MVNGELFCKPLSFECSTCHRCRVSSGIGGLSSQAHCFCTYCDAIHGCSSGHADRLDKGGRNRDESARIGAPYNASDAYCMKL